MQLYETAHCENLWARLTVNTSYVYVNLVNISPSCSDRRYFEWFNSVEHVCSKHSSERIVALEDFNLYSTSDNVYKYFQCFLKICNYISLINHTRHKYEWKMSGCSTDWRRDEKCGTGMCSRYLPRLTPITCR